MKAKSKRKPAQRQYIPRKEYRFWLRKDRAEDSRLMEFIQYCKSTRQFARVVRDGIRLIWSLREDNLDILFELFPHLQTRLNPPTSAPNSGDLERMIQGAVHSSVKAVMLEMPSLPATIPAAAPLKQSSVVAPALAAKVAPVADAATIADDFLAFIQ